MNLRGWSNKLCAPFVYVGDSMPKVTIKYEDNDSLTVEEIVKRAEIAYGNRAVVEISANSQIPHDQIYWALQQIVTLRQIEIMFDKSKDYDKEIKILKTEIYTKLVEILDQVVHDNEDKMEVL